MRVLPADPGLRLTVATDGAARGNPGPAGVGVHITDEAGRTVAEIARGIGIATNNVAEYSAAIDGLTRAADLGATDVLLRSDSRLLVEQLAGRFRVKNPTLQRLHAQVQALARGFRSIAYEHVPRERNKQADRLANVGVDEWLATDGREWAPPGPAPSLWPDDAEA